MIDYWSNNNPSIFKNNYVYCKRGKKLQGGSKILGGVKNKRKEDRQQNKLIPKSEKNAEVACCSL